MKKIIKNPLVLHAVWVLFTYCCYLLELRAANIDYDEEANPIINVNILIATFGVLVIAILTLIYQKAWYKRYYFTPLIIPLGFLLWWAYAIYRRSAH